MSAQRVERAALVVILLVVGMSAGAASFTHVHDWTMANSPTGTPDWFGWANAVISELVPVAALLTVRQRRRNAGTIGYPMFLLVSAVILSLSAQLAVAKPGPSGWLLSAVPALAFMGLSKLVLSGKVPEHPEQPAEEHPEQPARETSEDASRRLADVGRRPASSAKRRPVEETRRLAEQITMEHPELSRAEVAARLGISPRRLRAVTAKA